MTLPPWLQEIKDAEPKSSLCVRTGRPSEELQQAMLEVILASPRLIRIAEAAQAVTDLPIDQVTNNYLEWHTLRVALRGED